MVEGRVSFCRLIELACEGREISVWLTRWERVGCGVYTA